MAARTLTPTSLDRRVAAGLRVVAEAAAALALTPAEISAKGWILEARCSCGHRGFVSPAGLIGRGLGARPVGGLLARLACPSGCQAPPAIAVVDPWRSAADPGP